MEKELIKFGKEIIKICKKVGVIPVIYGSFAIFEYTKDKKLKVNDLDFYIPEGYIDKIRKILDKKEIKYNYDIEWRTIQVHKKGLKIELDSLEKNKSHWYSGSKTFRNFSFYGIKIKILSLEALIKIYKRASEVSKDNPEGNKKKYLMLKQLK